MINCTIGIDISKAHLDAHRLPDGEARQFTNDRQGFRELLQWLKPHCVERIIYEPTGACHQAFEDALSQAGIAMCRVNSLHARRFAQSKGTQAKPTGSMTGSWLVRVSLIRRVPPSYRRKSCAISNSCRSPAWP